MHMSLKTEIIPAGKYLERQYNKIIYGLNLYSIIQTCILFGINYNIIAKYLKISEPQSKLAD